MIRSRKTGNRRGLAALIFLFIISIAHVNAQSGIQDDSGMLTSRAIEVVASDCEERIDARQIIQQKFSGTEITLNTDSRAVTFTRGEQSVRYSYTVVDGVYSFSNETGEEVKGMSLLIRDDGKYTIEFGDRAHQCYYFKALF